MFLYYSFKYKRWSLFQLLVHLYTTTLLKFEFWTMVIGCWFIFKKNNNSSDCSAATNCRFILMCSFISIVTAHWQEFVWWTLHVFLATFSKILTSTNIKHFPQSDPHVQPVTFWQILLFCCWEMTFCWKVWNIRVLSEVLQAVCDRGWSVRIWCRVLESQHNIDIFTWCRTHKSWMSGWC